MSAAKNTSEQLSPCSSGKSVSEPGRTWNKGLVSCLRAISRRTQSAELEKTSKIPRRGKASPLPSRSNKAQPAQYHDKQRSERAKDSVLNESTHGEASKQSQGQDIMMKMRQLFNKTNTEETLESKSPSKGEILDNLLGGTITTPQCLTRDMLYSESEEDEDYDDLLAYWQDTFFERDMTTVLRTASQSSSASSSHSFSTHSLHSLQPASSQFSTSAISDRNVVSDDEYSLVPVLEQAGEPHVAGPSTDSLNRSVVAHTRWIDQHPLEFQSSRTSQISLESPSTSSFCQGKATIEALLKGASTTEDTLQSPNEDWHQISSRQLDDLNVDDVSVDSEGLEHIHECEAAQGGANAAQDLHPLRDINKELVWRPEQRLLGEISREEACQCRICHSEDNSPTNPLLTPCLCSGSLRFIHLDCLKTWIQTRVQSGSVRYVIQRCELCKGRLTLDPDTVDWDQYFPLHHQQQLEQSVSAHLLEEIEELVGLYQSHSALIDHAIALTTLPPALFTSTSPASRAAIMPFISELIRIKLRRLRARRLLRAAVLDSLPDSDFFTSS